MGGSLVALWWVDAARYVPFNPSGESLPGVARTTVILTMWALCGLEVATVPAGQIVEINGIRMRVAIQGTGPLVLLCHGFPESWYSWRHQLAALAAAGYRAVAHDMRGYGGTEKPEGVAAYSILSLVGDMVDLVRALGRVIRE